MIKKKSLKKKKDIVATGSIIYDFCVETASSHLSILYDDHGNLLIMIYGLNFINKTIISRQ